MPDTLVTTTNCIRTPGAVPTATVAGTAPPCTLDKTGYISGHVLWNCVGASPLTGMIHKTGPQGAFPHR